MKRMLALFLTLVCLAGSAAAEPEKYDAMPAIFAVTVEEDAREIDEGSAYVYKEYLTTTNPDVNAELRAAMDEAVRTAHAAGEEKAAPLHLRAAFLEQECTARRMMEQLGIDAKLV